MTTAAPPIDTQSVIQRTGTGTRDWTPPVGEFRPSSLGACPRYAWFNMRVTPQERPPEPIGRSVMMYSGHAAEHEYLRLLNQAGGTWTTDYELDNGFGGICHPDALDFVRLVVAEIKFTGFKSPAPYHVAQACWYTHRMSVETGSTWTAEVHLLDKYGAEPKVFAIPAPDAQLIQRLTHVAEQMMDDSDPPPLSEGMCSSYADAQNVKYYDKAGPKPKKGADMVCPHARDCFPPNDDFEL